MTTAPRIAHLAVVVRDLDTQTAVPLVALGLVERGRTSVPSEGAAVSFIQLGQGEIELLQPLGEGVLGQFLDTRGEGLHHLALRVPDIDAAIVRATAAGLRPAGQTPREGAYGTRVAFFHPASLHGLLLEFVESRLR
ncbi:MAG TPA: VOC family protein [bacterium]|nr:VOC family protein [bacterium]